MADPLLAPPLAGDERMSTLAAIAARISDLDLSPLLVYLVDQVNESALLHLAEQFHVLGHEGWNAATDVTARRRLIKRAIELHRHKGTPWAVRAAIETVGYRSTLIEWFEESAEPFHFRIRIDLADTGIDEATWDQIDALVTEYKNVRSHCSGFDFELRHASPRPRVAIAGLAGERTQVLPRLVTALQGRASVPRVAAAITSVERLMVWPLRITTLTSAGQVPRLAGALRQTATLTLASESL